MKSPPDAVRQRLEALAEQMEREVGEFADINRREPHLVELVPHNQRAVGVLWFDPGDELQVETLGERGGRWELGREDADVAFVEEVVRAVVEGRISEVFGPNRSTVTVTLSDGSTDRETVYGPGVRGLLPRPGWRRRGRTLQYEPYQR